MDTTDHTAERNAQAAREECDTCPFNSADPQAIHGHEDHAPRDGWLGQGERHTMSPTRRIREHVTTVRPLSPRAGSLAGHKATCACGWTAGTSLSRLFAERDAAEHVDYMVARAR
jgi:hypothetical protein